MSVNVPVYSFHTRNEDPTEIYPYGFAQTSGELDAALEALSNVFHGCDLTIDEHPDQDTLHHKRRKEEDPIDFGPVQHRPRPLLKCSDTIRPAAGSTPWSTS